MKEPRYAIYKRVKHGPYEYAIYDKWNSGHSCFAGDNLKELFYNCSNKLDNPYMGKYQTHKEYVLIFETDNLSFRKLYKKHPEHFV